MRTEAKALLGKVGTHGYFSLCLSLTLPAVSVGLRCGTIMVAKIRKNFCEYRMLWERLDRRESDEKALLEELLRNFCQYRMTTRM